MERESRKEWKIPMISRIEIKNTLLNVGSPIDALTNGSQ